MQLLKPDIVRDDKLNLRELNNIYPKGGASFSSETAFDRKITDRHFN